MIGRSTLCHSPFSLPVAVVGLLGLALIAVRTDSPAPLLGHAVMVVGLIPLVVIDLETRRLPRELSYPAAAVSAALLVLGDLLSEPDFDTAARVGGGAMLFALLMLVIGLVTRGGLGGGDVRLAPLLGANLGYHGVLNVPPALFVAALLALAAAAPGLLAGRRSFKSSLPFGPFLAVGTLAILILVA
jgi:leader peptidase (prepilin peptidase) / N-methyltransferase